MFGFYEDFYARVAHSSVHAAFCERVFGRNLCQHGFADMAQIHKLIDVLQIRPGQHVLDVGCGNGMIAEYIAETTGAHVTGLDNIPQAVSEARERTQHKADRLAFVVGDINALSLPDHHYDAVISIDSIYFSGDYARTIRQWVDALRPGGQIGILYSHGREPWVPREQFHVETLAPDHTPLAEALHANGLSYRTWNFTDDDYRLALLRRQVLAELRPRFEAEGLMFIYDNRMGDANGVSQAVEDGIHARYLYDVQAPG